MLFVQKGMPNTGDRRQALKRRAKVQKQIKGDSFAFREKGMQNTGDRRKRISKKEQRQTASAANVLQNVRLFFCPQRNIVGMAQMR